MDEQNDIAWVKAKIEEGKASGVIDAEPEYVLAEIIAKLPSSDTP
jgi:hypothetical protein